MRVNVLLGISFTAEKTLSRRCFLPLVCHDWLRFGAAFIVGFFTALDPRSLGDLAVDGPCSRSCSPPGVPAVPASVLVSEMLKSQHFNLSPFTSHNNSVVVPIGNISLIPRVNNGLS